MADDGSVEVYYEARAALVRDKVRRAAADVEAMPAGPHAMMEPFCDAVEQRVRAVLSGLADVSGSSLQGRRGKPEPRKLVSMPRA